MSPAKGRAGFQFLEFTFVSREKTPSN